MTLKTTKSKLPHICSTNIPRVSNLNHLRSTASRFSCAWLCLQSSWNRNSSVVRLWHRLSLNLLHGFLNFLVVASSRPHHQTFFEFFFFALLWATAQQSYCRHAVVCRPSVRPPVQNPFSQNPSCRLMPNLVERYLFTISFHHSFHHFFFVCFSKFCTLIFVFVFP